MIALRLFPFLKAVTLKFAYYALGIFPVLFMIWGKANPVYAFTVAVFAFIAVHFMKRELKKIQPVHERNLTEGIAIGLFILLCIFLVFNKFGSEWFTVNCL